MADIYQRAKELHPDEPEDVIKQGVDALKAAMPGASDDEILEKGNVIKQQIGGSVPASAQEPIGTQKPIVRDYLQSVYGDKFSDSARQKLVDENAADASGPNWTAGLAALGAGLQGGNAAAAGQSHLKMQQDARDSKLTNFDKARSGKLQDYKMGREMQSDVDTDALNQRERDPTSAESKMAQSLAIDMGMKPELVANLTAEKFKTLSPVLQKKYDIEQRKLDRKEARDERRYQSGLKMDEKLEGMKTPYGLAHNVDDAKKLKEAHESKKNFDSKLGEMIALREKHGGGALLNREDVGRGKQLSKDLLLEYKNMAKLGVLSQADEAIINEIIPADALEYNSPLAAIQGQDPVLHKLKKFKEDSDKDFATRVSTRTRDGKPEQVAQGGGSDDEAALKRQKRIAELRAKQNRSVAR